MTTPKVEIGFKGPARATAFQLDSPEYGLLDTGVLGIGEELVDLSARLVSLSIQRGRTDDTQPSQTGTASIVLRNRDGVLDPLNTASALYPGVEPRRTVNIYADSVQVFSGFVDDIDLAYSPGGGADVIVRASDGLSRIATASFGTAGQVVSAEDSGARIASLLSAVPELWTGTTDLDTGDSTLAAGTATGNPLDYFRQVAQSEAGFLFVDRSGSLAFRNRNNPAQNPGSLTVSDAGGTACTPYTAIGRVAGIEDLYTRIVAEYAGTEYVAEDPDAIEDYGIRELDLGILLLDSAASVQERLDYEISRRAVAFTRVREVTVDQSATSGGCSLTLQHDLGEAIRVVFSPPGVAQQTQDGVIVRILHNWTLGASWRTTFGLIARDSIPFLILDDVTYGQLDVGALAF